MQDSVRGLAELVQEEIGAAAGGVASRAALSGLSGLFFLVSLGFFVAAGTWALIFQHGVVAAMSIVGGVFFLVRLRNAGTWRRWRAPGGAQQRAWPGRGNVWQTAMRRFATEASLSGALGLAGVGRRPRAAYILGPRLVWPALRDLAPLAGRAVGCG